MTVIPVVPAHPGLPIVGSVERFPVRRAYCVGRNYGNHAREMGANPDREPPFFFSKPIDAVYALDEGIPLDDLGPGRVPYPPLTSELHHEVELVVAIGVGGKGISADTALEHVWGYALGFDLTRRDAQAIAKRMRRPWDLAKGFDASGPSSAIVPASQIGHPATGRIYLEVNGELRQQGDLADQIWSVPEVIAALSRTITLKAGDLIFTGTPAGIAALAHGDIVTAGIDGLITTSFIVD
jgi:fumarylpyruvate hydrolase